MKDAAPFSVDLESAKVKFLQDMAKQYGLPDTGKAIRCLIDFARENAELQQEIFTVPRCNDCG